MYDAAGIPIIWILCCLSVLLHELGHALGFRIAGGKAGWRVEAGSGPEILRTVRFTFRLLPVGGYFMPREEAETKKQRLSMLVGGPLVSLLLAALFWAGCFCLARFADPEGALRGILFPVCRFVMFYNGFLFLLTAVPMRYRLVCRGFESDGLQILRTLKGGKG